MVAKRAGYIFKFILGDIYYYNLVKMSLKFAFGCPVSNISSGVCVITYYASPVLTDFIIDNNIGYFNFNMTNSIYLCSSNTSLRMPGSPEMLSHLASTILWIRSILQVGWYLEIYIFWRFGQFWEQYTLICLAVIPYASRWIGKSCKYSADKTLHKDMVYHYYIHGRIYR